MSEAKRKNNADSQSPEETSKTYLSLIGPSNPAQTTPEIFCADPGLVKRLNLERYLDPASSPANPAPPAEICLEIARPQAQLPFREGEPVRVIYWDETGIVYCWKAFVARSTGADNRYVAVNLRDTGLTLQRRRAYRLSASIPFSFTVMDSVHKDLVGRVFKANTQNVSEGGLAFDTELRLAVGDKLELDLHLPESESLPSVAWVLRCEPGTETSSGDRSTLIALKFLQLSDEEQLRLLRFLTTAARDPESLHMKLRSDSTDTTIRLSPFRPEYS